MAERQNLFNRLTDLFRSNIIIRKTDGGQLRVKDVDLSQQALQNNFIDRYQRMMKNTFKHSKLQNPTYTSQRLELFKDYELMDSDPIISSALDVYSDESTVDNVQKETLTIRSNNPKIKKILHNLFYDVLNVDFNLWSWMRNLTKYGDFFLQLDILDKYGIVNVKPLSVYDVERLEDHDPSDPTKVEFKITNQNMATISNSGKLEEDFKQSWEIAHFRMLSDANFLPYGKSMLEGARKIFKQLSLMEDAMLIHRIMRAPEKRIFKVDIGNIPPNEVENFMNKLINKMKKTPVIDQNTGDYNLKYNMESVTEDFFLPVRGGDSGTNIETLQGLSNDGQIDDIEYLRNKLMAALKVPKAFLGYEEGVGSKATLAAEDVRFARTIERFQKIICAELEKIAIVHLYTQGFEEVELLDFELELTNPSMIHEQEKLELLTQKTEIASSLIENRMISREWIYDNIFDFDEKQRKTIFDQIIEDQKQAFRMEQITTEGNDPSVTGEKEMDIGGTSGMGAGGSGKTGGNPFDLGEGEWGGSEKNPYRYKMNPHKSTSKDKSDATKYEKQKYGKREFKHGSPLHPGKGSTIVKKEGILNQLKSKYKTDGETSLLNENSLIDDEKNKKK